MGKAAATQGRQRRDSAAVAPPAPTFSSNILISTMRVRRRDGDCARANRPRSSRSRSVLASASRHGASTRSRRRRRVRITARLLLRPLRAGARARRRATSRRTARAPPAAAIGWRRGGGGDLVDERRSGSAGRRAWRGDGTLRRRTCSRRSGGGGARRRRPPSPDVFETRRARVGDEAEDHHDGGDVDAVEDGCDRARFRARPLVLGSAPHGAGRRRRASQPGCGVRVARRSETPSASERALRL